MLALDTVANRQASWSVTANNMKAEIDKARWAIFGFSVLGAILATLASQMGGHTNALPAAPISEPRTGVAIAGALSLATATFFMQRLLGQQRLATWVRVRAISEALKREAYKFATGAMPYDQADADTRLDAERQKIEADGNDLLEYLANNPGKGSVPRAKLTRDNYITQRVDGQIKFYTTRANIYRATVRRLRSAEFCLALAATLVTAVASVTGKQTPIFGVTFDIAALTAVLTTVAGAILAHVEAARFDYLVTTYRATARCLEDRKNGVLDPTSAFVTECENIIAMENLSWIAKWTKPQASG